MVTLQTMHVCINTHVLVFCFFVVPREHFHGVLNDFSLLSSVGLHKQQLFLALHGLALELLSRLGCSAVQCSECGSEVGVVQCSVVSVVVWLGNE
jgi:hypothetical protein